MTLVVKTLSEQIFTLVRDRIITGKMDPETAIRQDALAAELGVSKIPLREAFVRLEQEGLLISQANRGFFVRPLSADEAEEVFALRLKLEPSAVAEASSRANQEDRNEARRALKALDQIVGLSVFEHGKLNRAFHLALVRPSHHPLTVQILERLNIISERYVSKHLEPPGREDRATLEHHMMLEAWETGKADEAAELVEKHISGTLADLRREFAN